MISGLLLCAFFVLLNIIGVKEAAVFQIIMVAGRLALMAVYLVVGFPRIERGFYSPFLKNDLNEVLITSGFISSVLVVTFFYTAITYVITGTLEGEAFASSLTPVADSARLVIGETGYYIILAASFLAFFTTANAGIMSASRYPMALSRDRLMPPPFGPVNKRFNTPTLALIITGALIYLTLLLPLDILVKAASTVILTSYILTNIAVIVLRESGLSNYRPTFKAPLYPWLQIGCILLFSFFIVDMGLDAIEISLALVFVSFCLYMVYGRREKRRESALLHLMKRITDSKLHGSLLEDELREVVIGRDEIEQDGFDGLIKKAEILDLKGPLTFEELLKEASEIMAGQTEKSREELILLFRERQADSNMALSEFLAVPHIMLAERENPFLLIARCREGVGFTEKEDKVKAVFFLIGSEEQRQLHLKTLASIASLVGLRTFEEEWLGAVSKTDIKNIMLLNNRARYR